MVRSQTTTLDLLESLYLKSIRKFVSYFVEGSEIQGQRQYPKCENWMVR